MVEVNVLLCDSLLVAILLLLAVGVGSMCAFSHRLVGKVDADGREWVMPKSMSVSLTELVSSPDTL